ncbi:MAG: TfoX/Sxy family protein [Propionicimonas sp.]
MAMTPAQTDLVERLRELLVAEPVRREVSMFGGRSFLINEKLIVSAQRDGGLLVRVDAGQHDDLLRRPGAAQAEMGPGRDMGPGWIEVAASAIATDPGLACWVEAALAHNRAVTGGS